MTPQEIAKAAAAKVNFFGKNENDEIAAIILAAITEATQAERELADRLADELMDRHTVFTSGGGKCECGICNVLAAYRKARI